MLTNFDIDQVIHILLILYLIIISCLSRRANTVESRVSYDYSKADRVDLHTFAQHYNFEDKYYKSDNFEYVWGTLKQVLKDAILSPNLLLERINILSGLLLLSNTNLIVSIF